MRGNFLVFWLQNGRQPQLTQIRSDHWLQKRFRSWHRSINTNSAAAVTPPSKDGGRMAGGDWTSKIQHPIPNLQTCGSRSLSSSKDVLPPQALFQRSYHRLCHTTCDMLQIPFQPFWVHASCFIIVFVTQLAICNRLRLLSLSNSE